MNIQPSLIVWTVICFILLMLVLKYLLFTPVFRVLDERKEKVRKAKEKRQQLDALEKEHKARLAIMKEDARIQRENYIKSERKLIKIKSKTELDEAKRGRAQRLDKARLAADREKEEIKAQFLQSSDEIVKTFAQRLINN